MADTPNLYDSASPGADALASSEAPADLRDEAQIAEENKREEERKEQILEDARKRLHLAEEAERHIRELALDDLEFLTGKQWPDQVRMEREQDGRPCLVVNRLPQAVQQITNDQRQNRPAVRIHPLDNQASEETAEIIQGIVRHIQHNSNAEAARDTAFEAAARASFGFYRITTGYVSPDSFDQEIYVKRVRNQFSVFLDHYAQEPDGSDANWGFVIDDLSPEDYRAQFPNSKLADKSEWDLQGVSNPDWVKGDSARVVEYYYKEYKDETIYLLSTGEAVKQADLMHRLAAAQAAGLAIQIKDQRDTRIPVIKHCKLNAVEILDETVWPGNYIPIIPVYGNEYYYNGKRVLEGVVRNAKDPQRMLNYWKSAQTEAIALAPRAPFIGAEGQFEDHPEWMTANKRNHPYLEYKPVSLAGQMAPAPQRSAIEPAVQAITQAASEASEDIKATTGVYDPAMGAPSNEISGVAIKARTHQALTGNYHLTDNLTRSIKHEGRILVDLIPKIYDAPRAARIIGDDGEHKVVMLNQKHKDESGKEVLFDVSVGRYDVTVDTGPSYATKREEAAAGMIDLTKAVPQIAQAAPDIIVRNMDWPGSQELSDRLKKTLPPALQDDPKQMQIPPQVQAQMQQMQGIIKQLTDHLNETTKVIETKKLDLESRERIELWNVELQRDKLQAEIEMNLAKLGNQASIALLQEEIGAIKHQNELMNNRLQLLNIDAPIEGGNDFNPQGADGGNFAGVGHVGSGPTGGPGAEAPTSPGQPVEGQP